MTEMRGEETHESSFYLSKAISAVKKKPGFTVKTSN